MYFLSTAAGGGNVKITDAPVKFNVAAKIPTAASASQHKVRIARVQFIVLCPHLHTRSISAVPLLHSVVLSLIRPAVEM
jgi:hypothetical protein